MLSAPAAGLQDKGQREASWLAGGSCVPGTPCATRASRQRANTPNGAVSAFWLRYTHS